MRALSEHEAIAIYGSIARGDSDNLSDRDILFVSNDPVMRRYMQSVFKLNGWSCTAYSWKRLELASKRKLLFMQHLKNEAKIIYDPQERLGSKLRQFSPKGNYKFEYETSKQIIGIIEKMPDCVIGRLWALDVLMVSLRSMGIAILANEGIYKFSISDILKSLIDIGKIFKSDFNGLSMLRYYKTAHRRGKLLVTPSFKTLIELIEIVNQRFNIGIHIRLEKNDKIVEDELIRVNKGNEGNWYFNMRRIELVLSMMLPKYKDNALELNQKRNKLINMIQAPADYGWNFGVGIKNMKEDLNELAMYSNII